MYNVNSAGHIFFSLPVAISNSVVSKIFFLETQFAFLETQDYDDRIAKANKRVTNE